MALNWCLITQLNLIVLERKQRKRLWNPQLCAECFHSFLELKQKRWNARLSVYSAKQLHQ